MSRDIVETLGPLMLGSRLKRLGEQLQADTAQYLAQTGFAVQPSQYPLLAALDAYGPLTIGELVTAVGVSQPGITRNLARLTENGQVEIDKLHRDQRHKTASLTTLGKETMARSRREIWPNIGGAVAELYSGLSGPLLEQLVMIEKRLGDVPLHKRAATISVEPHALDRVVWDSLSGRHARFAQGNDCARRFKAEIGPIAAVADNSPENFAALSNLVEIGGAVVTLEVGGMPAPPGFLVEKIAPIFQFIASDVQPSDLAFDIAELNSDDAPEMLALAQLTEPGPFSTETHKLGQFIGVRVGGRLAAMAGERMKISGYSEVSGVCTHPDFQGNGYAESLSRVVAQRIIARGEQPFLHCFESNIGAIRLYKKIGFSVRQRLIATFLRRV